MTPEILAERNNLRRFVPAERNNLRRFVRAEQNNLRRFVRAEQNNLRRFVPAAALIAPLYFLSPIPAPFQFAAIIACISNPLVSRLAMLGFVLSMMIVTVVLFYPLLIPVGLFYLLRDWNGLPALPASAALLLGLPHLGGQYRNSSLFKK